AKSSKLSSRSATRDTELDSRTAVRPPADWARQPIERAVLSAPAALSDPAPVDRPPPRQRPPSPLPITAYGVRPPPGTKADRKPFHESASGRSACLMKVQVFR